MKSTTDYAPQLEEWEATPAPICRGRESGLAPVPDLPGIGDRAPPRLTSGSHERGTLRGFCADDIFFSMSVIADLIRDASRHGLCFFFEMATRTAMHSTDARASSPHSDSLTEDDSDDSEEDDTMTPALCFQFAGAFFPRQACLDSDSGVRSHCRRL